jgi:hypothetical protein
MADGAGIPRWDSRKLPVATVGCWPGPKVRGQSLQRSFGTDCRVGQRRLSVCFANGQSRPKAGIGQRPVEGSLHRLPTELCTGLSSSTADITADVGTQVMDTATG